ncbi:MAG: hypothetical protein C4560_03770 [Nitrospiraceae bacterium]|nr:MAG: hypothetical protein C4560_03770 [Nitrospiraceae bacterium]
MKKNTLHDFQGIPKGSALEFIFIPLLKIIGLYGKGLNMVKTEREIKEIIERYKEALKKQGISAQKVFLYGSYAKGTFLEEIITAAH